MLKLLSLHCTVLIEDNEMSKQLLQMEQKLRTKSQLVGDRPVGN